MKIKTRNSHKKLIQQNEKITQQKNNLKYYE
jgi:hypothetical protein